MQDDASEGTPGWTAPICQPLTRRTMYGGVPVFTVMMVLFMVMQILNFQLYSFLVVPAVLYWILRKLYERDAWGPGAWVGHIRDVIQRNTHLTP